MHAISRQFTLSDGRRLGYDDHGPPAGRPVFLFHGTPSSRYDWYLFGSDALAEKLGIRVIAPDRPGLGIYDLEPSRRIADWPANVAVLADRLGIDRFAVLGYSGGGPYVTACALLIPERLTSAAIVSGVGTYDGPGPVAGIDSVLLPFLSLARDRPQLTRLIFRFVANSSRHLPVWPIIRTSGILPRPDYQVFLQPRVRQVVLSAFLEAVRPGPDGVCLDTALMVSPWGFDPRQVAMPVHFWHGQEDRFVSPAKVRYLADALPKGRITLLPHEGHVSTLVNHAEEILRTLVV